jgi:hypothetical protein
MSIGRFLNHRVSIVRQVAVLDHGQPVLSDYGQPVVQRTAIATGVPAGLQPKRTREVALASQAGAAIGDWTIFMYPRDVTEADSILHVAATCLVPAGQDLSDTEWELTGVHNAAGVGHHLEIDGRVIATGSPPIELEPAGSGDSGAS